MSTNCARIARRWCVLVLGTLLSACGGGGAPIATLPGPTGQPTFVFTGPTIPASTNGEQELFTSNLDGSGLTQLTNDGTIKFLPHFSPDGRRILYTKFLTGGVGSPNAVMDIAVFDLGTLKETVLTHDGVSYQAAWSPDGSRIVHSTYSNHGIWIMNADGSNATLLGAPSGSSTDMQWADPLWSSDNWIYFVVEQTVDGCAKVRMDRIRPDGTSRTQITNGGPNCSSPNQELTGDADPAISPDGTTMYSSRGLGSETPGLPGHTLRHLYTFSSAPYVAGKPETDISGTLKPSCIAGVPKVSPNGLQIAVFLLCEDDLGHSGISLTNATGSYYTFVENGFGADWNPALASAAGTSSRAAAAFSRF
jgi:Tol biopolymer transport system component